MENVHSTIILPASNVIQVDSLQGVPRGPKPGNQGGVTIQGIVRGSQASAMFEPTSSQQRTKRVTYMLLCITIQQGLSAGS